MMNKRIQSDLKRDTKVHILVSNKVPFKIVSPSTGDVVGRTLEDGKGVYLHNVNFKVMDGQPILEGRYKGRLEELRLNMSEGQGVAFYPDTQSFMHRNTTIKTARMVLVYNGVIKVVIK
jgi:hypothetical protein